MSIFSHLIGGGAAELVRAVGGAADSLFTSAEEKGRLEIERRRIELEAQRLRDRSLERQTEINRMEALHDSVLVAGWRPCAGWICCAAMAYHFLFFPLFGPLIDARWNYQLLDLDWQELSIILMGLLGLSSSRSYEKGKGVARASFRNPAP